MHQKHTSGFSLIELLITIAVVAILLALGLPSFQDALRSNRVATATNELIASFALARSEAIRTTHGSGICTSTAGTECDAGSDWDDGWLVWSDSDDDGDLDTGADAEPIIRYIQGHANLELTGEADNGASPTIIAFDPRGRVFADLGSTPQVRTITLIPKGCDPGQALQRTFTLNITGQYNVAKGNCP